LGQGLSGLHGTYAPAQVVPLGQRDEYAQAGSECIRQFMQGNLQCVASTQAAADRLPCDMQQLVALGIA